MSSTCASCLKSNATASFNCGACGDALCKKCARFLDTGYFAYWKTIPESLKHGTYCSSCYDVHAAPQIETYDATMEAAKNMYVFSKGQGQEIRSLFLKRTEPPLKVENCVDYDDVVMHLSFLAAQKNFNVIVDLDASSEKQHNGSYVTLTWSGSAIPVHGDLRKLERGIEDRFKKSPSK